MKKLTLPAAIMTGLLFCTSLSMADTGSDTARGAPFYNLQFNTTSTGCIVVINGVDVIDNLSFSSGSIATGLSINAFLENGENTIALHTRSLDALRGAEDYRTDAQCKARLYADFGDGPTDITGITITANEELRPTAITTPAFSEQFTGPIRNLGYISEESYLWDHSRTFTLSGLPEWRWTTAPKLNDTPDMNRQLREAYRELWETMHRKDYNRFKQLTRLAMEEYDIAEGFKPGFMLSSLGYEQYFKSDTFEMQPLNFELRDYKFTTYANGRLLRLDDGNGLSPVRYYRDGVSYSYNPYFSMIDGKLQVIR